MACFVYKELKENTVTSDSLVWGIHVMLRKKSRQGETEKHERQHKSADESQEERCVREQSLW